MNKGMLHTYNIQITIDMDLCEDSRGEVVRITTSKSHSVTIGKSSSNRFFLVEVNCFIRVKTEIFMFPTDKIVVDNTLDNYRQRSRT